MSKKRTVTVPKDELKKMILEESRRMREFPSEELIEDLLHEVRLNLREVKDRVPGLIREAKEEGRSAKMARDDLAALNERLQELVAILRACEKTDDR